MSMNNTQNRVTTAVYFENAQRARETMIDSGWLSLCLKYDGITVEHWVKNGRCATLVWEGELPEDALLRDFRHVEFFNIKGAILALPI